MTQEKSHPVQQAIDKIHAVVSLQKGGALAGYIPELAKVEPDCFGIALMSVQGRVFVAGDVDVAFTIQSVSKAFSYCMALELIGRDGVKMRVGVEPSGDAFNAIEFDPVTGVPYNPMVNAGAIAVTGILCDLASMAATLANIGQNPATGQEVFDLMAVRDTLSVMLSCGMYDYSGSWIYDVGIAAKSGVAGGLIGVVSRQMGIGTFAPRLDAKGNSVQGVAAFTQLADELGLHMFDCTNTGSSFLARMTR